MGQEEVHDTGGRVQDRCIEELVRVSTGFIHCYLFKQCKLKNITIQLISGDVKEGRGTDLLSADLRRVNVIVDKL